MSVQSDEEDDGLIWEIGYVETDDLIDHKALEKVINDHIKQAVEHYLRDIELYVSGDKIVAMDMDVIGDDVKSVSLAEELESQVDGYQGVNGAIGGPQADLDKIKQTLAILEFAVARYNDVVDRWVVDEWNEEEKSPPG